MIRRYDHQLRGPSCLLLAVSFASNTNVVKPQAASAYVPDLPHWGSTKPRDPKHGKGPPFDLESLLAPSLDWLSSIGHDTKFQLPVGARIFERIRLR